MALSSAEKATRYGEGSFPGILARLIGFSGTLELIRHNTNLVFDGGDFIVRLTPNSFRPREEVLRELHWMGFVGHHTPDVVRILNDSPSDIQQLQHENEEFTVTLFEKIDGTHIQEDQWNPDHFEQVGALTGLLHRLGQEYQPAEASLDLEEWDRIPEASLGHSLPKDERDLRKLSEDAVDNLRSIPRQKTTYGPIHYDIHPGNYFLNGEGRLILFDFENSCRAHYINDIAVAVYYAHLHKFSDSNDPAFVETYLDAFWRGYAQNYPIPEDEITHLPWFILNRSLLVRGYLEHIWPGDRSDEQLDFVRRVDQSIENARTYVKR